MGVLALRAPRSRLRQRPALALMRSGMPPQAAANDACASAGPPFAGFWMGGYEGADHVNAAGCALDLVRDSGHLDRLEEDHRRAAQMGLACVRESIGWRLAEDGGGHIDLARALRVQASARRHGLQVLWTLVHYGLPQGLSLHDDALVARLARFADEVARVLGPGEGARPPVFTPINEISFLAWAAAQPGLLHPPNGPAPELAHTQETSRISGYTVKRRLARAALAAMAAIVQRLPHARFLHVEPVVHVVAPPGQPELEAEAARVAAWQWQAWDLIAGRAEPELGGHPRWLDLVGINHYHSSQWELGSEARLDWAARDPRRRRLHRLLAEAWLRYHRPLLLAETSHVGQGRAAWLHEVASEVQQARTAGVPVEGVCLYPLVDRPDWQQPERWHRSGLWHVDRNEPARPRRVEPELRDALRRWQQVLPQPLRRPPPRVLVAYTALRWDLLRHRTRHLLQGLAEAGRGWRVVVVEEPRQALRPRVDVVACGPQLQVLVPYTPGHGGGFHPGPCLALQRLLCDWLAAEGLRHHTAWVATPMAGPLARALRPDRVVYDCIDEMGGSASAHPALEGLEAELLATADHVCAASAALAAARAGAAGPRLQLLPNGVDLRRFRPRRDDADAPAGWDEEEAALVAAPLWQAGGPQLGYAGAIDERVDLALLAQLADARPQWHFVLLGPVLKLDPATLPRRPNLHWLGAVPYRLLPALMSHWQLALLPFVRSATTCRARPLKVLEALAMGLPVVAAPLPEMEGLAAAGVSATRYAADGRTLDAPAFLRACEAALAETPAAAAARRRAARRALRGASWAAQVQRVLQLLEEPAVRAPAQAGAPVPPMKRSSAVVSSVG